MDREIPAHILEESRALEERRRGKQKEIRDNIRSLRIRCNDLRREYNRNYPSAYFDNLKSLPAEDQAIQESLRTPKIHEITKCEDAYVKMVHDLGDAFEGIDIPVDIGFANSTHGEITSKYGKFARDDELEEAMKLSLKARTHDEDLAKALEMSLERPTVHSSTRDDEEFAKALAMSMDSYTGPAGPGGPGAPITPVPRYGTLVNCGNSCYMNSSLQLLNSLSVFHNVHIDDILNINPLGKMLRNIFRKLENSHDIVDLRALDDSYGKLIRRTGFEFGRQSDPVEFMNNMFEHMADLDIVLDLIKTKTINYYIGTMPTPHEYIFNCEYIFDSPSLEDIMTRIRMVDGVTLRPNSYFIFQIGRFYYRDKRVYYNESPVIVNNVLNINGVRYIAQGCICFNGMMGSGGHYIYVQFDNAGNPYFVYNDSRKYPYSEEATFRVENKGYIFLYRRADHVGGSKGYYANKYLKYSYKLRKLL